LPFSQDPANFDLCVTFHNKLVSSWWRVIRSSPNCQPTGLSPVGCPRLFIQYIPRYLPHLEAVSSFHNPRTRHTVVTGIQLIKFIWYLEDQRVLPHEDTTIHSRGEKVW